jgi:hypothetical protein
MFLLDDGLSGSWGHFQLIVPKFRSGKRGFIKRRFRFHLRERRFSGPGRQERAEKRTMRETEVQIANSGLN